jgi:DbpA RNA binding domain
MVYLQNLLRFIRKHTGVKEKLVSTIEIKDEFNFISVPKGEAYVIQKRFSRKHIRIAHQHRQTGTATQDGRLRDRKNY